MKAERVGDEAVQADFAEHERAGARVVHQTVKGGGDAFGAGDTLLDFLALLGIGGDPSVRVRGAKGCPAADC